MLPPVKHFCSDGWYNSIVEFSIFCKNSYIIISFEETLFASYSYNLFFISFRPKMLFRKKSYILNSVRYIIGNQVEDDERGISFPHAKFK